MLTALARKMLPHFARPKVVKAKCDLSSLFDIVERTIITFRFIKLDFAI